MWCLPRLWWAGGFFTLSYSSVGFSFINLSLDYQLTQFSLTLSPDKSLVIKMTGVFLVSFKWPSYNSF